MTLFRPVAAALLLTSCRYHFDTPVARVHHGPAVRDHLDPLAAMPVTCPACSPAHLDAMTNATRMGLELAGHEVVDTDVINAESRRRTSLSHDSHDESEGTTVVGQVFTELPPAAQKELLTSMGVHGVMRADLFLGPPLGAHLDREVTVTITVHRLDDDAIAWTSRCTTMSIGMYPEPAIQAAVQCALEGKTLW